jgi:hypothetical protein
MVAQKKKSSEKFEIAFGKYKKGKLLTREDLVALINKMKVRNDAANGKNIKELTMQWEQRKHQLDKIIDKDENVDLATNPHFVDCTSNPRLGLDLLA